MNWSFLNANEWFTDETNINMEWQNTHTCNLVLVWSEKKTLCEANIKGMIEQEDSVANTVCVSQLSSVNIGED